MSIRLYYFTGTGNSLFITKEIAKEFKEAEIIPINNETNIRVSNSNSKVVGFIFPVYCLDIPRIVKKALKEINLARECYTFIYYNYGGSYGNTPYNVSKILKKRNRVLNNYYGVNMPENSIVYPVNHNKTESIIEAARIKISASVSEIKSLRDKPLPKRSVKDSFQALILKLGVFYLGFKRIKADPEKCSRCNKCIKLCPVKNIYMDDLPRFKNRCEMCFSCIHYCNKEALAFEKMKYRTNYQYKNPYIDESELYR